MQQNINSYDQKKFKSYFEQTEVYQCLKQDFDDVTYFDEHRLLWLAKTPRQEAATRNLLENKDVYDSPLDGNLRIVCHKTI